MLALREAAASARQLAAAGRSLYVTLEPCAMCAGAIVLARVSRASSSARPTRRRARPGSVLDVLGEPRLNHRPEVASAACWRDECAALLQEFFASRR